MHFGKIMRDHGTEIANRIFNGTYDHASVHDYMSDVDTYINNEVNIRLKIRDMKIYPGHHNHSYDIIMLTHNNVKRWYNIHCSKSWHNDLEKKILVKMDEKVKADEKKEKERLKIIKMLINDEEREKQKKERKRRKN